LTDPVKKYGVPRVRERFPIAILAENGRAEGETRDITVRGMFIHCLERLRPGENYRMVIKFPEHPVKLTGQLVWCNLNDIESKEGISGMGLSFLKVADEDRKRITEAIAALGDTSGKS